MKNNPIQMIDPYGLYGMPLAPPGVNINYNIRTSRLLAKLQWFNLVRPGGGWDYKKMIIKKLIGGMRILGILTTELQEEQFVLVEKFYY